MIRVLITDDHPVVRRGLRQILEDNKMIGHIEEASDGRELCKKMLEQDFDIILLDISMPGRSGLDLIDQIKKINEKTSVLILSMHSEEVYVKQAFKRGASGYINKSSAPHELVRAIKKVYSGGKYISDQLSESIVSRVLGDSYKQGEAELSIREAEVLVLLSAGKTLTQISKELMLSPKTISTYRGRLLKKLNLKTTADLIRYSILRDKPDLHRENY